MVFDPFELDTDVTPTAIREAKSKAEHTRAVVLSFRLNEHKLIEEVLESIPSDDSKYASRNHYPPTLCLCYCRIRKVYNNLMTRSQHYYSSQ